MLMDLERKTNGATVERVCEEIKRLFGQSDKSELSILAFRIAAVLHEGVVSVAIQAYRGVSPFRSRTMADSGVGQLGLLRKRRGNGIRR